MKVFLMYPDRDLDPEQELPSNAAVLIQDLELTTLFQAMAQGDEFLFKVVQQTMLSSLNTPDTICYRQEILRDCLKHPQVVRQIYQIPIQAIENRQKHWMGIFTRYPSAILSGALDMLEMFFALLKELRQIADEYATGFESRGFRRFFGMIQEELDDDYFAVVTEHLKELKFRRGVLLSAEVGVANTGENYTLRKANHKDQSWIEKVISPKSPVYSASLGPRDDAGARALGELRDRGVNQVANAAAQSAYHIDSFFKSLRLELAFYIGCLNLSEQLAQLEAPIVFPQTAPASERRLSFTGLYDITLALTMKQKPVANELNADNKDLVFITGANQGGKSTFLRSIGLAHLMMQCGMFVPAQSFAANICEGLFTHYKREEDTTMESGKFDEELGRMSKIVDHITPNSMVLFNESFAATNEREGSEIARQITCALLKKHIKVFYVTHLYELANGFYDQQMENAIFLRAERRAGGERTFKLIEGKPLQTSYGQDVYRKIFKENPHKSEGTLVLASEADQEGLDDME
jgi:DNA mismatch repair ATPase MutS